MRSCFPEQGESPGFRPRYWQQSLTGQRRVSGGGRRFLAGVPACSWYCSRPARSLLSYAGPLGSRRALYALWIARQARMHLVSSTNQDGTALSPVRAAWTIYSVIQAEGTPFTSSRLIQIALQRNGSSITIAYSSPDPPPGGLTFWRCLTNVNFGQTRVVDDSGESDYAGYENTVGEAPAFLSLMALAWASFGRLLRASPQSGCLLCDTKQM